MYARGTIVGLTRGSGRNHIIRAALESIAYQTEDILSAMQNAVKTPMKSLKVDGGASKNRFLMQFQSDISNVDILRADETEATALGAAYLAGLTVGLWKNRSELKSLHKTAEAFSPAMNEQVRQKNLEGWHRATLRAMKWEVAT